jgi:hypothetical protein
VVAFRILVKFSTPGLLAWESDGNFSEPRRIMMIVVLSSWVKLLENLVLGDEKCFKIND